MRLALSHLSLPKVGEQACGDAVVTRQEPDWALLAVVDALGHGPKAAEAAVEAVRYLGAVTPGQRLDAVMLGLHGALRGTRGAAAMVCLLEGGQIEGCGVGNVELRGLDARLPVLLSPGILGSRVERFRTFRAPLPAGRLVFFSDGISSRAPLGELRGLTPDAFCLAVMERHRKTLDDATILVCDIEG